MAIEIVVGFIVAWCLLMFVLGMITMWFKVSAQVVLTSISITILIGFLYVMTLEGVKDFSSVASVASPGVW